MSSQATSQRSRVAFRPDIEGLRGVAVVVVVLFHTGAPGFGGGYIGVDVFFALSGYLITGLILSEIEKTSAFSFRNFYARRVRRLLPASGLMVVGVLLAGMVLYSPLELWHYATWGTYTSLYFSNFMFMREAGNYFGARVIKNPFLHTWSLAVEEQFYLLWPALIVLVFLRSQSRRRLAVSLLVVTVLSLAASIWLINVRQSWAFYSLPTRAWEFGAGGLACLLRPDDLSGKEKWLRLLSWTGLAALLEAAHSFYRVKLAFPGYFALVPVAGTLAMLLEGALGTPSILQRILAGPPLQWLGRLSYSWYLWHWPFLIYANAFVPGLNWRGRLLVASGALVMAQLTYWLLENPIRFNPFLVTKPALSLGLAVLVPAVGVSIALTARHAASIGLANGEQQRIMAARAVGPWYDCLVPEGISYLTECTFGDQESKTDVVLFGDSHGGQWFSAVNAIAQEKRWRLVTLLKANCQIAARDANSKGHVRDAACETWREKALERIAVLRPVLVVLGESTVAVANPGMVVRPLTPRDWGDGLRATLNRLDAMGTRTLVMADTPAPSFNVVVCLSRVLAAKWGAKSCVITRESGLNQQVRGRERAAVSGDARARWADFSDILCPGSYCLTIIDNLVVYRDDDHISEIFARHLAPRLLHEMDLVMEPDGSPTIATSDPAISPPNSHNP